MNYQNKTARRFKQYLEGWEGNDFTEILSCLTKDCTLIESHGPTYHGIEEIKKLFDLWLKANSRIIKWNILSFYCFKESSTAFAEWDFLYISNNVKYSTQGISLVKYFGNKISFIHEYRMLKPSYRPSFDSLIIG